MAYKHGAFGQQVASTNTLPPSGVDTLPVYVGTAPVQQLVGYAGSINKPILVNSYDEAKAMLGYSDDWDTFTLCEAVYAHFKNGIQNIGPIVLINVLDPTIHKATGNVSMTVTNKVGYINEYVILDTIAITGSPTFTATYVDDGRVMLTFTNTQASPVTVTYQKIDKSQVLASTIVGGISNAGKRTGIACVELIYQQTGYIASILAAPGWSQLPAVYTELVARCQKINGHWDAICAVDIDSSLSGAQTIANAITKKTTDGYTSKYAKVCWPKAKYSDKKFWLSTLAVVRMQQTDYNNGNVPSASPSNQQILSTGTVLVDGTAIEFDEVQANTLNAVGITTVNYTGGVWKLWGPHMGNYTYGSSVLPEEKFDSSIRMLEWLSNSFQQKYIIDIDGPLTRRKVESILDDSQYWINGLVADGKMLYGKILFQETSNPNSQVVEGDFVFDIGITTIPVAKSLTFKLQYTTAGLSTLFGGAN